MDGESKIPLPELIMETGAASENTSATETKSRQHLGDHDCRTFAFIGGDRPHFIFSGAAGWGRFYVTDTQVALSIEDGARYIADLVRAGSRK